jgi:glycogen debranching enzyme
VDTLGSLVPVGVGHLWEAAVDTLAGNWTGAVTLPSRSQYPHQWSWDSAFIAIGLAEVSQERAQHELLALLGAQWGDGRLPHIVYNDATEATYFPGPAFWASRGVPGAPAAVSTSGIVQPPVHARAALTVFTQATDVTSAWSFLAEAYPKLAAQHRHLVGRRDVGGGGLASIVHPWESGMDNSPAWDPFLAGLTRSRPFTREDQRHVPAAERPSDADYSAYVALAEHYRDLGYDDRRLAAEHPFTVEDPLFNAILLDGELCLAEIARHLGHDPSPHRTAAKAIHHALLARLWDDDLGTFVARDARTATRSRTATIAGFAPLLDPWLPASVRDRLIALLLSPGFLGGGHHPVPTTDLRSPAFDRRRYWRGPTWVNTNWLVWLGTSRAGRPDVASTVRDATLALLERSGFREYFDPLDGTGRGAHDFSWSAALALTMLSDGAVPLMSSAGSETTRW